MASLRTEYKQTFQACIVPLQVGMLPVTVGYRTVVGQEDAFLEHWFPSFPLDAVEDLTRFLVPHDLLGRRTRDDRVPVFGHGPLHRIERQHFRVFVRQAEAPDHRLCSPSVCLEGVVLGSCPCKTSV